jgi:TM2 domain-containing membrane protein YozV
MSGATFGRKGASVATVNLAARRPRFPAGESAPPRQASEPDPDLAARRAAFLAAERARPRQEARRDEDFAAPRPADRPPIAPKSLTKAYMRWFFGGGLSAHRFYLGFPASAIIQLMLTPISYVMVMNKSSAGLVVASAASFWLVADAFLIPGLVRRANERGRGASLASTFG